ncbi:transposase [Streptomyces sp. NPDC087532]|uniref:transposase n=1 Tax=Streptomyces sp. NPDC087532 TaxID=3365795 RepID=UPI0038047D4B
MDRPLRPAGPRAHPARRIVVVRDNLNTHRTAGMKKYVSEHNWLTVFRLPSYAPDLNPSRASGHFFDAARRRTPPSRTRTTSSERSAKA